MLTWDPLHDLVPFVQFEKEEKHPSWWKSAQKSVTVSLKQNLCFANFLEISDYFDRWVLDE